MILIPVQGSNVTLGRGLAPGAKLAIYDVMFKSLGNTPANSYKLIIETFSADGTPLSFNSTLQRHNIANFKDFKSGLFRDCFKIRDLKKIVLIRDIISRMREV